MICLDLKQADITLRREVENIVDVKVCRLKTVLTSCSHIKYRILQQSYASALYAESVPSMSIS